jgi:hypothetical protein
MSLFNPWILLGIIMAILGAGAGGYSKGKHDENARQQAEIAVLNEQSRQKEQALVAAVNTQAVKLQKANQDAKIQINKRNADIATGAMQLRVPVKATVCAVQATGDAAATSGADTSSAELQPAFAQSLIAITDEADELARKYNTCINAYETIRQTLKGKP